MSSLRYLCLWCPTHTSIEMCFNFVYLRLAYHMLPVSRVFHF
jgi:hypothetical protein